MFFSLTCLKALSSVFEQGSRTSLDCRAVQYYFKFKYIKEAEDKFSTHLDSPFLFFFSSSVQSLRQIWQSALSHDQISTGLDIRVNFSNIFKTGNKNTDNDFGPTLFPFFPMYSALYMSIMYRKSPSTR
jgi:hypothetical protein